MNLIDLALLVFALGVFPVFVLFEQVRRDYVGKRRNQDGRCYKCASATTLLVPVRHYKGEAFMYCAKCAQGQELKSRVASYVLLAIAATAIVMWAIVASA